ncbi:MAG TPA: ThuA domain-containing protein [Pirellulaceae bacterium]|nr:ThuA domain-containing protein [Pirellulaceae bacterium]
MRRSLLCLCVAFPFLASGQAAAADSITVHKRQRVEHPTGLYQVKNSEESWSPKETAIIVCDVWDSHHCLNAVRRVMEMAPRMNQVLEKARSQGVLVIHAPSGCMETYQNHPGRKIAQSAPKASNLPADIHEWCRHIPAEDKGKYPIDQTDGGEDDDLAEHAKWHEYLTSLGRNPKAPWKAQIDTLKIVDGDAISDSGIEIWNLLEERKIKNVILVGVHTNMCVLGRPFGLRQMAKNGKNVVLMRDMTDTMYNPAKEPFVNHFTGTELIVQHIEKYVCPTITSVDILGGQPFRFKHDRHSIVMIIGDDEYKTEVTLPQFAKNDLEPLGFSVKIIHSDEKDKNQFPGLVEAVKSADVVLVSVRRRLPPKEQLDAIRAHLAAGKPLVGIRTACHAWCLRDEAKTKELIAAGHDQWPQFDAEVIGGNYTGHHGDGPKATIAIADGAKDHPILRGIEVAELVGNGSLYRVQPLKSTTTPLLMGMIPGQEPEPVAWTNLAGPQKARVFNTSLGHPEDFTNTHFRKLLTSGIFWALEPQYAGSPPLAAN